MPIVVSGPSVALCLGQEGGESNWSDLSADGNGKMLVFTPSSGWLDEYLLGGMQVGV